jgi:hypothetical protein
MTPSKSEERRHKTMTETQDMQPEQDYNFPTIGLSGVTIRARSQAEAQEKAKKLMADMAKNEKPVEKEEEKSEVETSQE